MHWETGYTQTGWQCPSCGRCYSPSTSMCSYCGNQTTWTLPNSDNPNITYKWWEDRLREMVQYQPNKAHINFEKTSVSNDKTVTITTENK